LLLLLLPPLLPLLLLGLVVAFCQVAQVPRLLVC
jgi:hypothetical protein